MAHPNLFTPYERGALKTGHRVAMAPLTRNRAVGTVPGPLNAEYYAQRAEAAILVSEGTHPAAIGQGYLDTAGLHNDEQQAGWTLVADAVHAAGDAKLFVQLMHCGRVAHPYYTGETPVAPSAIKADGGTFTPDGQAEFVLPRELATEELPALVEDYVQAARRAVAAGCDGVELHAANGYLLHQFVASGTNHRTDGYGTDVAGRIRFPVEVATAVAAAIGPEKVGIRISPGHPFNDIEEEQVHETYDALIRALAPLDLAYLHVLDSSGYAGYPVLEQARELWPGTLMGNEGFSEEFTVEEADQMIADGKLDLVAYGRRFIANPDLPTRLRTGAELNEPDSDTFYAGGPKGYTDYPTLEQAA
ncbi:MAG: 1,2-oxophytodienoate reductase [Solirubrobacterales bacterium]|jgi:N-ethylmaleimide reductase|nr:1,2-oxophytodienoate reductase [Solirubrobacterales bacterium]